MIFSQIPEPIQMIMLALIGAVLGAAINWAIYRWTYVLKRKISPWQSRDDQAKPRKIFDYVPILGWLGIRRDAELHGKGFWIRPLLIELVWAIGLPWFYYWHAAGGLSSGGFVAPNVTEIWFLSHSVMFALLTIATFIDFDERMIPDGVTVTGFVFALLIAAVAPTSRLPVLSNGKAALMHFNTPDPITPWHQDWQGLALCLLLVTIWFWALIPKWFNSKFPIMMRLKWGFLGILRPRRKTKCDLRTTPRKMFMLTKVLFVVWVGIVAGLLIVWNQCPAENVTSLFSSVLGMAVGGGIIWAIRIIGKLVLGQEAMGFGDVTLMFMIGAFVGWQGSLLVMALAPFAGLFVALGYFIATRENKLAFGPYLSFAAIMLILNWFSLWQWAEPRFFLLGGQLLLGFGAAMLALMAILLYAVHWMKLRVIGEEELEGN